MLIFLLGHEDINVQVAAAQAIGVMALNVASCESIGNWGTGQNRTEQNSLFRPCSERINSVANHKNDVDFDNESDPSLCTI